MTKSKASVTNEERIEMRIKDEENIFIGKMDSHCGDCYLIEWCGEPFSDPYLCHDDRFKTIKISDYLKLAEASTVKTKDVDVSDVKREDYNSESDYEEAIDEVISNTYKKLVADDVAKKLNAKVRN